MKRTTQRNTQQHYSRYLSTAVMSIALTACGLSPSSPTISYKEEGNSSPATAEAAASVASNNAPAETINSTVPNSSTPDTTTSGSTVPVIPGEAPSSDPIDAFLSSGTSIYGTAPTTVFNVGTEIVEYTRTAADGTVRSLPTKIYYPAATAGINTPSAEGKFPLILWSHGSNGDYDTYPGPIGFLVKAGFIVAAPNYPFNKKGVPQVLDDALKGNQSLDASQIITYMLLRNTAAGDKFFGHIDASRGVGAAGHSLGGLTTHGMLGLKRDERITSAIIYAGGSLGTVKGPSVKVLFQHGDDDPTNGLSYASTKAVYNAVPDSWPKAFVTHFAGGHWEYLWPSGATYLQTTSTSVDWFRWAFYNDAKAMGRLAADSYLENKTKWESSNLVNILVEAESYAYMSGVKTEACTEGGMNVSAIETNDWLSWNVELPNAGKYIVEYRVSSLNGGGVIQFENAGGVK
ncbi:MAG: carbohydrate-binding protein, partial [Proteobacteria bacterium]